MSEKGYYVTLTGGKNNAGDFLIKFRAEALLKEYRSDRNIIDMDGWQPLSTTDIEVINKSKALILLGGPALQEKMRPRVYALTTSLEDIKVPIITMGIGWYSPNGEWSDTHNYPLNEASLELLDRIASHEYQSSVRDYHTLNALHSIGYENYMMTGCPALFSLEHIDGNVNLKKPTKIGFSLGVSLKASKRMEKQMKDAVLATIDFFPDSKVEVVFHHGLSDNYLQSDGVAIDLYNAQTKFLKWLKKSEIPYVDISGSAERLIEYYSECDFHIGYRVHAHIFCNSISKASVLLNEDGRGKALRGVIGGANLDMYESTITNKAIKAVNKLGGGIDNVVPARGVISDLKHLLNYELEKGVKLFQPRKNIDLHFDVLKKFVQQLP